MHLAGEGFGGFFCGDANRLSALHVDKRCGHFSPVAEFKGALAEPASRDHAYGVGRAAVDFDEGDETLAVFAVRVVDAEFLQTQHREAHAQDLAGTEVTVGLFGVAKVFVEGFHKSALSFQPSAFSLAPITGDSLRSRGDLSIRDSQCSQWGREVGHPSLPSFSAP